MNWKNIIINSIVSIFVVALLCITLILISSNPYIIRFEMDNNTLEATKYAIDNENKKSNTIENIMIYESDDCEFSTNRQEYICINKVNSKENTDIKENNTNNPLSNPPRCIIQDNGKLICT